MRQMKGILTLTRSNRALTWKAVKKTPPTSFRCLSGDKKYINWTLDFMLIWSPNNSSVKTENLHLILRFCEICMQSTLPKRTIVSVVLIPLTFLEWLTHAANRVYQLVLLCITLLSKSICHMRVGGCVPFLEETNLLCLLCAINSKWKS